MTVYHSEDPWVKAKQLQWRAQAKRKESGPLWDRVRSASIGYRKANGHARFGEGGLAKMLGVPNDNTLGDAITAAVDRGWLEPWSCRRCLVPKEGLLEAGLGVEHAPCPEQSEHNRVHDRRKKSPSPPRLVGEKVEQPELNPPAAQHKSTKSGSVRYQDATENESPRSSVGSAANGSARACDQK